MKECDKRKGLLKIQGDSEVETAVTRWLKTLDT